MKCDTEVPSGASVVGTGPWSQTCMVCSLLVPEGVREGFSWPDPPRDGRTQVCQGAGVGPAESFRDCRI